MVPYSISNRTAQANSRQCPYQPIEICLEIQFCFLSNLIWNRYYYLFILFKKKNKNQNVNSHVHWHWHTTRENGRDRPPFNGSKQRKLAFKPSDDWKWWVSSKRKWLSNVKTHIYLKKKYIVFVWFHNRCWYDDQDKVAGTGQRRRSKS